MNLKDRRAKRLETFSIKYLDNSTAKKYLLILAKLKHTSTSFQKWSRVILESEHTSYKKMWCSIFWILSWADKAATWSITPRLKTCRQISLHLYMQSLKSWFFARKICTELILVTNTLLLTSRLPQSKPKLSLVLPFTEEFSD